MNKPNSYNNEDEKNYIDILKITNAQFRNYDSTKQIRGSKSYKYKTVIGQHFPTHQRIKNLESHTRSVSTFNSGITKPSINCYPIDRDMMMEAPSKSKKYVYYDEPNKLVDRLRFLIASEQTGNNSNTNEINSIIEKLMELDLIE